MTDRTRIRCAHDRDRLLATLLVIVSTVFLSVAPAGVAGALEVPIGSTLTVGDTLFVRFHLVEVPDPFNTVSVRLQPSQDLTGQNMTVTLYNDDLEQLGSRTSSFFGVSSSVGFVDPSVDLSSVREGHPGMVSYTLNSGADIVVSNVELFLGFTSPSGGSLLPIGGTFTFAINQLPAAPGPLPPAPVMIRQKTRLTADHFGSIVIEADGVALNCDGYSITGVQHGAGILLDGRTGVTVENCVVSGFQHGFSLRDSDGNRLKGNIANNNGEGFSLENSNRNSLVANAATSNAGSGFSVFGASSKNTVEANVAAGNSGSGFLIDSGSFENVVKANQATANRDGFTIDAATGNTIKANAATGNTRYGFLAAEARDNLFKANEACSNLVLDAFQFGGTNTFKHNDFCTTGGV